MTTLFSSLRMPFAIVLLLSTSSTWCAGQGKSPETSSAEQMEQLKKYPLNDFGEVFTRMQKEIEVPAPRPESQLLPLLPKSTVFYAAIPNFGNSAQQALKIFREERQSRPALREWWQSGDMKKNGAQFEMAIQAASNLSQYVGDEIVIAGSLNGSSAPSVILLAQVRKPGLKEALDFAMQLTGSASKPSVRVVDKAGLASATETMPRQLTVLVRPDYVLAAPDLETVRSFSRQLDAGRREFASTAFGQKLQQAYSGGLVTLAGADLETILQQAPMPPQQGMVLQQTGFADMKYAMWEHRGGTGHASSEMELSFTRPRRGVASWLAAPRDLRGLEFASPKAILVASIALKSLGEIFEEVRGLATTANPNAFAQLDQMQQGLGISLKDDLLGQLGGEITVEVDDVTRDQSSWKAMLQVNDTARLERTFGKLLGMAPVQAQESREDGVTYHSMTVPSPARSMEVGYAFVDGYLLIGSGEKTLRESVRLHREGGSLAKSSTFLASLPPGHSTQASALYYQDPLKMMSAQLARFSPELGASLFHSGTASAPTVTCAYADETTIRGASMSQGMDVSTILIAAAVAIPNLMRARNSANESAAVGSMRNIVTAQLSYSTEYPARGFARDLAALGADPNAPGVYTPKHAGLLDMSLAKPTCTAGTWCEKSGYKFTLASVCPRLLCQEFVAIATPAGAGAGSRNFCATSDGVIRFRTGGSLFAPISARECRTWQPLE